MRSPHAACLLAAALLGSCANPEPDVTPVQRWSAKSRLDGLSETQRRTYEEMGKLHTCRFTQTHSRGGIDAFSGGNSNPMAALQELGLDTLPFLAEALDDATLTETVTITRGGRHVWRVSDLVVMLIRRIADRRFVFGEWGEGTCLTEVPENPGLAPAFQQLVQVWYAKNHRRSVEERKISDLQSNRRNRLDAAKWLGNHKCWKAVPALIERIETVLGGNTVSSSTHAELAECSLALGRIGRSEARGAVKSACDHLSHWFYKSYRPIEQGRSSTHSGQVTYLFNAYHGLALLGRKRQALAELRRLLREYGDEMESNCRREYEKRLRTAEEWGVTPPRSSTPR